MASCVAHAVSYDFMLTIAMAKSCGSRPDS